MLNKYQLGGLAIIVCFGMLTGCASIMPDYNDQSYSEAPNQPFAQALKDEQWVRDEYAEYRSRRGHKAFAVAISHQTVIATGFGDDKITMQWAEQEALRMCHHYSAGDGTCVIVDKDSKQGRHGLSQAQIDAAPKELIAHRDIIRYQDYSAANAPKAFVVAACSGQSFWLAEQDTVTQATEDALLACEDGRHASDPCCMLLESE